MPPPERQKNAARETRAINQYQLADCIGKGAFGAVYKALNMENGETVAIKQVKLSNIPRSELGVIMMEIDLLKKLNHPNIVKYNGFVKTKEYLNIILEFCENGSLTSIVKKFGKFPENLVAVYVVQVLEGLRYLHEQGVIHRDIKGANILTTKEGLVKLADFGVATRGAAPGSDAPVEEEAMVVGSPYWMAPEVIELSGATTASDVWSVGCTVIELLQGQPPYHDLAPMPALFRIVQDDHPPLPEGASGGLKDFLMQCFQKDYNLRVSAKKLLKHPWIQSARRKREAARETYGMNSMVNKFAEDVRSVQQWNAAINEPIHRHAFKKAIQQELDLNQPLQTANGRLSTGSQTSKDENWDADFADALSLSGNNLAKTSPGIFEYPSHEAKFSTSSTIAGTATSPLSSNTSLNDRSSEMSRSPSPSKPPLPPGSLGIRKRLSAVDLAEQAEEAEDCWDNDFEVDDTEVAATRLVELKLRKSLETVQTMDGKINDRNKSTRENAPQGEKPKFNERDNDKQKNNERHVNDAPGQVHNRQDRVVSIDEDNTQTITMNFKKVLQAKLQPSSVKPAPSAAKPQTFISTSSATPVATATFLNPPVLAGASSLPPMLNFAGSKYMESEADDVYDDVFAEEDEKILHEKLGKLNINFAGLKVGDTSRIKQRKPVAAPNETSRRMDAKQAWTTSDARELVMTTTLSLSTGSLLTTTVGASDPGASEITETPKTTATLPPNATKPSNLKQSNSPLSARLTTTPVATGSPKAISAFLTTAARSHTTANTTTGDSPSGYKAAASRFFASFRDGRRNQPEQKVKSETSTEVTTATGDELTLRNRKVEHLMELDIFGDDEEEEEDERPVRKEDIVEADEEGCDTIVLRPGRVGIGNLPRDVKGADLSKEEEHESEIPANRTGPLSRYAETDDDDYDDVFFGNSGAVGPAGMGLVNGELEKAELKIRSRARSFGAGGMNGSPNGESQFAGNENCRAEEDEEEDDDPFASLEEGMDEPDLEENVLRDKHARLCSEIESLIRQLQPEQAEDTVQGICDELLLLLTENPTLRSNVITYHGVIPIMELLEQRHQPSTTDRVSANVVQKLLRIVNLIIEGSIEIQENFCLVGGVPCVTAFASSKYPFYVRLEAARFVRRVCQASTLSLQMFVSGRGLRVLAGLLAGDYGEGKELVLTAIDGVASVFELQGPTPKNDFCRLFANCGLLEPLASALSAVSADRDPRAQDYVARIVHVLLIFSQADAKVKELVATRPVVKKILGELDNVPPAQTLGLVKCIKNLSMTSTALDTLEKAGAIETLAELLSRNSGPYITEMYNQVLNALYNLCRLNRRRQEAAAQAGVVPPLQRLVKTNSPLKQFALPVLCDLAYAGKICRGVLWQNDGLRFYLSLLGDPYWQINALEAVSAWLSDEEEKMRLEAILVVPGSVDALSRAFLTARTTGLEKLLDPLYKILVKAQGVARLLVERNGVAQKISERLKLPNAQVRLGVLRVLAALTETHPQPLALITKLGLQSTLHRLAAEDPGLLVRELAAKLAAGVKAPDPGTPIATPVRPRPEGRLPPVEKGKLRGG